MAYNPKDYYFHKAKSENFAARSVFKLEEIDKRFRIIRPGDQILDLGAAPGSWSQYCSQKIGFKGRLLGIDLQPVKLSLPNAVFIVADMHDLHLEELMKSQQFHPPFDLVLSDMAPKTTGIAITDQARSLELCELALVLAKKFLRDGGHFVCKLFQSGDFESFRNDLRNYFSRIEILRPKSTRRESKEIFFIGLSFRGEPNEKTKT